MRRRWLWALLGLLLIDGMIVTWWSRARRESRYDRLIAQAAARHKVDPALVKAVVWRESNFNPRALGTVGELGLMQIRGIVAKEWAQEQGHGSIVQEKLYDPETNIEVGTWYLAKLLKRYRQTDNPMAFALADYNAGRTQVLRWMQGKGAMQSAEFIEQIKYPSTQQYIHAIVRRSAQYGPAFRGAESPNPGRPRDRV